MKHDLYWYRDQLEEGAKILAILGAISLGFLFWLAMSWMLILLMMS